MSNYTTKIAWLIRMFQDGYIAVLDADKQEIIDVVWEGGDHA